MKRRHTAIGRRKSRRGYQYHQGLFQPKHPEKYMGDPKNIIFRSGLEERFFKYIDEKSDIIKWGSEEFSIPYYSPLDEGMHRYYVDVLIQTSTGKTFALEIKPLQKTKPPPPRTRQTKSYIAECAEFVVNEAKWKAAKQFCEQKGWVFRIVTEQDLLLMEE